MKEILDHLRRKTRLVVMETNSSAAIQVAVKDTSTSVHMKIVCILMSAIFVRNI